MKYFTEIMHDPSVDYTRLRGHFEAYFRHLELIRHQLPRRVYEFAAAEWHYDNGERGLHDSCLESLVIEELPSNNRGRQRSLQIRVRLLSAFHDRKVELRYIDVLKYKLHTPAGFKHSPERGGHGDWLYDEIDVSRRGLVVHEVRFSRGGAWQIECNDIDVVSTPIKKKIN